MADSSSSCLLLVSRTPHNAMQLLFTHSFNHFFDCCDVSRWDKLRKQWVIGLCQVDEGVGSERLPPTLCLYERLALAGVCLPRFVMRTARDEARFVPQHLLTDSI